MSIGALGFLAPWLLLGLAALPILWWLLRAVPPAPARRPFPGVRLLLGLVDPEKMPERTPWWLLLLRMLALAAAITAFAGPTLNPRPEGLDGPLVVLLDGGWGAIQRKVDQGIADPMHGAGIIRRLIVTISRCSSNPANGSGCFVTSAQAGGSCMDSGVDPCRKMNFPRSSLIRFEVWRKRHTGCRM
jgi:hypothetical protein